MIVLENKELLAVIIDGVTVVVKAIKDNKLSVAIDNPEGKVVRCAVLTGNNPRGLHKNTK